MAKDFFDDILIKLKREYQKDEILSAIIKENSELNTEIGKLKSEIQHLEYEIVAKKEVDENEIIEFKKKFIKEINREIRVDNRIIQLKEHVKKQDKLIESLRKNISELVYKNYQNKEK